jgi:hypothetical protein
MPKEIKQMLRRAGIKPKDLRKKETAVQIYELLLKSVDFQQVK